MIPKLVIETFIAVTFACGVASGTIHAEANRYAPEFIDTVYLADAQNARLAVGRDYDADPKAMRLPFEVRSLDGSGTWNAVLTVVTVTHDTIRYGLASRKQE